MAAATAAPRTGSRAGGEDDFDTHPSRFDLGEWRATDDPSDSRFLSRQARRIASSGQSALFRLYSAFVAARAALGVVLLATEVLLAGLGSRAHSEPVLVLCAVYATAALALYLAPNILGAVSPTGTRLRRRQWTATIGLDLAVFSTLHLITSGGTLNYSALLVFPALMAGVLTPRLPALGVAAAGTMGLLAGALLEGGAEAPLALTQARRARPGRVVVVLLAGELAGRLAREERHARGSLELARQQARLNRLVLEEMQEGVLVVDRRGRVRAANPAALALLGATEASGTRAFDLGAVQAWAPLAEAVERAFQEERWPESGRDVTLPADPSGARPSTPLRLRVRFTQRQGARVQEDLCVLFLETLRTVQARVRQEKLAAMGRVSAGIAHEIRNPLAAIVQANALLAEDAETPQERQLTRMVADAAERLKRIVDDVMEVAPGRERTPGGLDATAQVAAICADWARTVQLRLGADSVVQVELPEQALGVVFDGEHLRRVLVNLLDNALRHGSGAPGAVRVRLCAPDEASAVLSVCSDGAPIAPDVERFLFEPFFSSRSRGTGLGLYICRELCERYGASIDYRAVPPGERHRNEFLVTMRRTALAEGESRLHLAS